MKRSYILSSDNKNPIQHVIIDASNSYIQKQYCVKSNNAIAERVSHSMRENYLNQS